MSQCQLNFNCQISFTHQAAKQNNPVDCIAGALLAFLRQGIEQKSRLFYSSHYTITTTGADKLRSQLVGSARQDTKKQTGALAVQAT